MIVNPFHNNGSGFGILPISGEFLGLFFSPMGLVTDGHLVVPLWVLVAPLMR
jgi:hypothetical protein